MQTTSEKEIGGVKWRTKMLPTTKGLNVFTICTRLLGFAIQSGTAVLGDGATLSNMTLPAIGTAIGSLFEKIEPGNMAALARDLLASTDVLVDGEWKPIAGMFDDYFAGEYRLLFDVSAWVFEVNFKKVFTFSSIVERFRAALADQKAKPSTSGASSASRTGK